MKAAAVAPIVGLPLAQNTPIEKAPEELTEEEKAQLWEKYKTLVYYCSWKIKKDPCVLDGHTSTVGSAYSSITGGVIDPAKPLYGRPGEWVLYKQPTVDGFTKGFKVAMMDAAQWWRNKNLGGGKFDSPGFDVFMKEVIWQHSLECLESERNHSDEPDGPWAEGWEERCGDLRGNFKGLPVVQFEKHFDHQQPTVESIKEIVRDVPWEINKEAASTNTDGPDSYYKKTVVYVREEDSVLDVCDRVCFGEMDLYVLDNGWFGLKANENTNCRRFNERSRFAKELKREKT